MPIDRIKIDRSFIRDIPSDANDMAITKVVIILGKSLGLEVLAEGIETEGQQNFLLIEGWTHDQGYLFEKPLPADEFLR